jgi:5-methyltetrahydrofolate--homocysteine methyltransferase
MSALLTTTMVQMRSTIEALEEAGVRGSVKIMIGGAPVTQAFAQEIGADAYAPDAASAVDVARDLAG